MPPKRNLSMKRKASAESPGSPSEVKNVPKKVKQSQESDDNQPMPSKSKKKNTNSSTEITGPPQPSNTKIPDNVTFAPTAEGVKRISAWNVCGLAASMKKGFRTYVEAENADVLILTETKVNNIPVDPKLDELYPYRCYNISDKKGYAGTAVLSKIKPLNISHILPDTTEPENVKGRLVILEFTTCWLFATYVPNAGDKLKNMDKKVEWLRAFELHLRRLDSAKPIIWAGDINVAPTARDLRNDKSNWNKSAGYTAIECEALARILAPPVSSSASSSSKEQTTSQENSKSNSGTGYVDIWRELHPNDEHYTYFSYKFGARSKGIGWRLDMFIISERLRSRIKTCEIRDEIWGASDHVPIVMDIEGDL
ncbi:hypothetical protein FRC03_007726 [Tulasnella sp. 419]|nr:hypothetical protein FRC02_009655 [Tulasnella sp. 418]KAG8959603.1 hypothetical protein FRC03_007726 [Tulasnella sp. 419]